MRKKYRALERRMLEVEKVVDRCFNDHGSHLHASTVASIRAKSLRYSEGLLCLMTADELSSDDSEPTMLREQLTSEIKTFTVSAIDGVLQPASSLIN